MKRGLGTRRAGCLSLALVPLCLAVGIATADAQASAPPEAPASLDAVDFNFVGQANLGAPFQVDSGRLAETKGSNAAIRGYAHLMVTSVAVLTAPGFVEMQGGLPIVVDGEVIDAIGASFDTPEHDVKIAQAGLAALPR